jgi:DNA processing protein
MPFVGGLWRGRIKTGGPGIGSEATLARIALLEKIQDVDELLRLGVNDIKEITACAVMKNWKIEQVVKEAERDLFLGEARGFRWTNIKSDVYPPLLKEIYDPPAVLFYRGELPDPEKPLAAMVGTRHPSAEGSDWAYTQARLLGRSGVGVVSGLALGIDAESHRGNVDGGGRTAAVLGSGIDMLYPASNRRLAVRILDEGGVIFSELPPGTRPAKWTFPGRNRIIAGLARAVVIVDAPLRSGSLITAGFARDENRDLYVAAGEDGAAFGEGAAGLAQDGAALIQSAAKVLEDWGIPAGVERLPSVEKPWPEQGSADMAASLARELGLEM